MSKNSSTKSVGVVYRCSSTIIRSSVYQGGYNTDALCRVTAPVLRLSLIREHIRVDVQPMFINLMLVHRLWRLVNIKPQLFLHRILAKWSSSPANKRHWANSGSRLTHCSWHWINSETALGLSLMCVGLSRNVEPLLALCWSSVADGGTTLSQHWLNVCWDAIGLDALCTPIKDRLHKHRMMLQYWPSSATLAQQ